MAKTYEYGHCLLLQCTINGIPWENDSGEGNYVVREFKIFEDHCKPYFTAELMLETYQHAHDYFIFPTAEVILSFQCPSSDPSFPTKKYSERFRIFSHESRDAPAGQFVARYVHTLSLIGQEYYNDKHNNVMKMDSNIPATAAASKIHKDFVQVNDVAGLKVKVDSTGFIGSERHPHQSTNLKPFKAINDLLDRAVWTSHKTCSPVYFRRKDGYAMGPLQAFLESSPLDIPFKENQNQGNMHLGYLGSKDGYCSILAIKPLAPSGESSSGVKASEISGMLKGTSYFESKSGTFNNIAGKIDSVLKGFNTGVPGLNNKVKSMFAEAYKGNRGGGQLLNVIDEIMQSRAIDKNGPTGYNVSQEALVTALTYADKYWVQVPGQSGHKVTCGDVITVQYHTVSERIPRLTTRKLYVARLVHHVKFYEGDERKRTGDHAKTEMYGVSWG